MSHFADHLETTVLRTDGTEKALHDAPEDFNYQQDCAPPNGDIVARAASHGFTAYHYSNDDWREVQFRETT